MKELTFAFRMPKFPVLCSIDGRLVAAKTKRALLEKLVRLSLPAEGHHDLVDSSGEGWTLAIFADAAMVSPISFKKRWTKREVIALFNETAFARERELVYSDRSLSAKRIDRVLGDLVDLLAKAR